MVELVRVKTKVERFEVTLEQVGDIVWVKVDGLTVASLGGSNIDIWNSSNAQDMEFDRVTFSGRQDDIEL